MVASGEAVKKHGLKPLARIMASSWTAGEPWRFAEAPIQSVNKVLDKLSMSISDFDLIENNEAFSINSVLFRDMLGVSYDKINVNGGAIALGHPIGASGARILGTLTHALVNRGLSRGMASICHGTGGGTAIAIERV